MNYFSFLGRALD